MTRASELLYLSTYTPVNSKYEPMLVDDCYFKKNFAGSSGGAISMIYPDYEGLEPEQTVVANNSVFKSNIANGSKGGGVVFVERKSNSAKLKLLILHSLLESNVAIEGSGGFALLKSATGDVRYCTFLNNRALEDGGSIAAQESKLAIFNSTLTSHNNESAYEVIKSDKAISLVNIQVQPVLGWKTIR